MKNPCSSGFLMGFLSDSEWVRPPTERDSLRGHQHLVCVKVKSCLFFLWRFSHLKRHAGKSHALFMIWLVVSNTTFMTFHLLGMSSSQLTNSYFSEGLKPPTSDGGMTMPQPAVFWPWHVWLLHIVLFFLWGLSPSSAIKGWLNDY